MCIQIFRGADPELPRADVNIVIDVIRAFTVAHYAFANGVRGIFLARTVEEARRYRSENPGYMLAGEIGGLPIDGFELDNSPVSLLKADLDGKYLIQKTTNGVTAALHASGARHVLVTGFSNARKTAEYVRNLTAENQGPINIIASHPSGDDDFACAEFMREIISGAMPDADITAARIRNSAAAQKFADDACPEFDAADIVYCTKEEPSDFVMKVSYDRRIPMIERVVI
ncbi:2-phosphosulfolactate phosphatase [Peribacillus sp. SCS-37]|uniref:2-phosphosulfolactate phosphatase n=1 Tax=Paraperibacillus esterisolvens TaxID=3115296 RepID=UPI00390577C9